MKKFLLAFLLVTSSLFCFSQNFKVPIYQIQSPKDCDKYNKDVLKAIDWLMNTPPSTQLEKQQKTKQFLIQWMTDTKAVSININSDIVNFFDKNADLLIIYMCGCTKYALENNVKDNQVEMSVSGIELCVDYYNKNIDLLEKDTNLEKYIQMKDNGTLKDYIKKNTK